MSKKYASPRMGRQIRIRSGKISLLLGTFEGDGVVVNSSMEFNLVNELRRFLDLAKDPETISLQITSGEEVLKEDFPTPDGLTVLDAADLISARSRVQCCLDMMMAGSFPEWVDHENSENAKLSMVRLVKSYDEEIKSRLTDG